MTARNQSAVFAITTGLVLSAFFLAASPVLASWEAAARFGFDSNVNQSVGNPMSDEYFAGYLSFIKDWDWESRFGIGVVSSLEGGVYLKTSGLDYGAVGLSPALSYIPWAAWVFRFSPFFHGTLLSDSEQSSLACGVKVDVTQRWGRHLYSGEYYVFTNSWAQADVYSFMENGVGVYLGVDWTANIFTEVGYEFARGDSFTTVGLVTAVADPGQGQGQGKGRRAMYSKTFDGEVVQEMVNRHVAGLSFGINWTEALFSMLGYAFTFMDGQLGNTEVSEASVSIGYRF